MVVNSRLLVALSRQAITTLKEPVKKVFGKRAIQWGRQIRFTDRTIVGGTVKARLQKIQMSSSDSSHSTRPGHSREKSGAVSGGATTQSIVGLVLPLV